MVSEKNGTKKNLRGYFWEQSDLYIDIVLIV